MKERARIRRPDLPRRGPVRRWSGLFGGPFGPGPAEPAGDIPTDAPDAVRRGVEMGYRVIDDYMREGQRVAAAMTGDSQDASPFAADPQQLAQRMLKNATDLASAWMEMMSMASGPMRGEAPAGVDAGGFDIPLGGGKQAPAHAEPQGRAGPVPAATAAAILVSVSAARPSKAQVRPVAALPKSATVSALPARSKTHTLDGLSAELHGGTLEVSVTVAADQAPGVYHGLVLDEENNVPLATVTVDVE